MNEMGLFETIHSPRALRRFKPDPVPDDVLARILDAAIRAPSACYPINKFGPVNRRPLREVVAVDRFGETPEWARNV